MKPLLVTTGYRRRMVHTRLTCLRPPIKRAETTFAREVADGLCGSERSINPKFFYNQYGSLLFEKICDLPEYYLTRAETEILYRIGGELAGWLSKDTLLVELGSGSSLKTRLILDAFSEVQSRIEYLPIDISDILEESCHQLLGEYKKLHVTGIIDTYQNGLELVKKMTDAPKIIVFLGSSFGNFGGAEGGIFLKSVSQSMRRGDLFLIGLDLIKERRVLKDAYDDSQGITARFNLNVLSRINEELDGDFDLSKFAHMVRFNEEKRRIEMYLKSRTDQTVTIPKSNLKIDLLRDDLIHTEHSHKYTIPQICDMMDGAGFGITRIWQDSKKYYALVLCQVL